MFVSASRGAWLGVGAEAIRPTPCDAAGVRLPWVDSLALGMNAFALAGEFAAGNVVT